MACVRKHGDGYRADWRDKKGNRYRKTFAMKKAALDYLADIRTKKKAGSYIAPKDVPTLRVVAERWFANKQAQRLRPASLSSYRTNLDQHILRADFADAELTAIDVGDIEAFRDQLARKKTRTGTTLAARTIGFLLRDLESIFAYAMKVKVASWNPVSCVDRPKLGSDEHDADGAVRTDAKVREDAVLSPADCRKLIDTAADGFNKAFLMLAVMTGARHDELLALKWADIDFDATTVHFRRSLTWAKLKGEPTRAKFFDSKTGAKGNRKLPCAPELLLTLKKWKLACPKGDLDLVFPRPDGEPQHRAGILDRVFRPTLMRAGLDTRYFVHSLRHSFISALLAQGTPPTEVQKYSGHARLSVLLDTYGHFIPTEATGALDRLASKVLGVTTRTLG